MSPITAFPGYCYAILSLLYLLSKFVKKHFYQILLLFKSCKIDFRLIFSNTKCTSTGIFSSIIVYSRIGKIISPFTKFQGGRKKRLFRLARKYKNKLAYSMLLTLIFFLSFLFLN